MIIEGLKITISGVELAGLCVKQADHHRERVAAYAAQLELLDKNQIEGMNYTGAFKMHERGSADEVRYRNGESFPSFNGGAVITLEQKE